MKIRVTLKDPDSMHDSVVDALAKEEKPSGISAYEWQSIRTERAEEINAAICEKWMKWGEYLTVEFDTESGTATVIENKR